jgi:HAD superfamily hydrolase (TIGR01509 family)
MPAILFGSIGSIADTSELQRRAFNEAFRSHGLAWQWDQETYADLLRGNGGNKRIADYAADRGETVDAAAVHRTKSDFFHRLMAKGDLEPRPGVTEVIERATAEGTAIAFVTTTSPQNVTSLLAALAPAIFADHLQLVVTRADVADPKPAPEAYAFALRKLGLEPSVCVAIEDNVGGVESAVAAGIACVAFPGTNNVAHNFFDAAAVVERLEFDALRSLVKA